MDAPAPKSFWSLVPGRRFRRALGFLLTLYLAATVVLLCLETTLVFPASPGSHWVPPPSSDLQDVTLTVADGSRIHGWWCPQPGATDAILYCHGNGGNISFHGAGVLKIREWMNASVLLMDYPGYGKSEGSPTEAGCYATADAAYDWLCQEQKAPPSRILLYGSSMGGGVVTDLATRREHRALVLFMTFTSMPDAASRLYPIFPVHWLMRTRFDNRAKLPACKRPIFLAHGDADTLVPIGHSHALYEVANEPKQGLTIQGLGHQEFAIEEMFQKVKAFLAEHAP